MTFSILFIVIALFYASYGIKVYSEKYDSSFDKTNEAIQKSLEETNITDSSMVDSYKGFQGEASAVNKTIMLLFFLAMILFLIFWLVIMLRRSIIQ
jgi:uncharacterized membrane protein YtjA (UPF0391 family)